MKTELPGREVESLYGLIKVKRQESPPVVAFALCSKPLISASIEMYVLLGALSPELREAVKKELRGNNYSHSEWVAQAHPDTRAEFDGIKNNARCELEFA